MKQFVACKQEVVVTLLHFNAVYFLLLNDVARILLSSHRISILDSVTPIPMHRYK